MTGKQYPDYWLKLGEKLNYEFPVQEVKSRSSDHFSFYKSGIPTIWQTVYKKGVRNPFNFSHTIYDTIDKINFMEMREFTMLASRILLQLANETENIFEPFTPEPENSGAYDDT